MRVIKKGVVITVSLALVAMATIRGAKEDFRLSQSMDVFFNIYKSVASMYVDPVDGKEMIKKAADAMLSSLDPYTEFIPEDEVEDFQLLTTRKYGGVGSLISAATDSGGYVRVMTPYRGFPIDKAGITAGDSIVAIDGKDMAGAAVADVSSAMKGEPGSQFTMTVGSMLTGKRRDVILKRERIAIPAVPYAGYLNDSIGYIALETFSQGCADQVRQSIIKMQQQGELKGLILDLRDNGGGIMGEAIDIISLFVPKGSNALSSKGRNGSDSTSFTTRGEPILPDTPLAVMVNSSSASASEIVSGALQDMDRAVVVGRRTFGKGLIQTPMEVGFGNMLKVTTAKYYIPSGRCIQALDYSHRNEDGSVGEVPDSLISEFYTMNGRKVYDGGGVMPDVEVTERHFSKFPVSLLLMGFIDNFSIDYFKENRTAPDIRDFKLSDEQYDRFKEYISDKEISFISYSEHNLTKLKESAERELYYEDIKEELEAIEKRLMGDRESDLELYRDDITAYIEQAIMTRYHYSEGEAQRKAITDEDVQMASEILGDIDRYSSILQPQ